MTLEILKSVYDKVFRSAGPVYVIDKKKLKSFFEDHEYFVSSEVTPTITSFIAAYEDKRIDSKVIDNDIIVKSILSEGKGSNKKTLDIFTHTVDLLEFFEARKKDILNLIDKTFPNASTDKTITIKELALINLLDTFSFIAEYIMDLSVHLTMLSRGGVEVNKVVITRLTNTASSFGKTLSTLTPKSLDTLIKTIPTSSATEVESLISSPEGVSSAFLKNEKDDLGFVSNFVGNPFYHIRMWWADIQHDRYERLKANKEVIEHILFEARQEQTGEHDPQLEKRIEYYSKKLQELEYKIKKYENS